jgi:hypothetical protein
MSPAYVQPYVKAQRNDERDAEAIAEAAIGRRSLRGGNLYARQKSHSVRHESWDRHRGENTARGTAQDQFAQSRMAISAHH